MKRLVLIISFIFSSYVLLGQVVNQFNHIDNTIKLPEINTINTLSIDNAYRLEDNINIVKPILLIDGYYKADGRMIFNPEQKQDGLYIRVLNGRKTYMIDEEE